MAGKVVLPKLGAKSFSCPYPNCGAQAHQSWLKFHVSSYNNDESGPFFPSADVVQTVKADKNLSKEARENFVQYLERILSKEIFIEPRKEGTYYLQNHIENLHASRCYSCGGIAIWHAEALLYPSHKYEVEPAEDMPADVRLDFLEAATIVDASPRGAAALLRLSIQKLMPYIGGKGDNINDDIKKLATHGLDERVQQALDLVRVVGNNAVHPGKIDVDDKETAIKLFELVNTIVQSLITVPKSIEHMYQTVVPESERAKIAKRDGVAGIKEGEPK